MEVLCLSNLENSYAIECLNHRYAISKRRSHLLVAMIFIKVSEGMMRFADVFERSEFAFKKEGSYYWKN